MKEFAYNRYYNYREIEAFLQEMQKAYPDICRLKALAKTNAGRTVWGVTLAANCTEEDTPEMRPAFYIQAGTHAEETGGVTGALALLFEMLEKPEYRKQLETVTVYITPCVNPDGCDNCLTKNMRVRSTWEQQPEGTPNALKLCDVDGDGRILQMRWEDPTGLWKAPADCGGLLVERLPGDTDGPFYNTCFEGILENYDDNTQVNNMRLVDMNRNYPFHWVDLHQSGDFPGKYTETRTVIEFLLNHPNIFMVFDLHNGPRGIFFAFSENQNDAEVMRKVMALGKKMTGIECFREESYNENPIPGGFNGYVYHSFGVISGTAELGFGWDSADFTFDEITSANANNGTMTQAMISKIVEVNQKQGIQLAAPWVKYDHPQLGEVEIGGRMWGNSYMLLPSDMLETLPKVIAFLREMMQWHPQLELVNVKADALGGDVVRVRADVINTGKLGTTVLKGATGFHVQYPLRLYISGADEILSRGNVKEFDGLGALESQKLEWFVRAKPGTTLTVTATHPKGGVAKAAVTV